MGLFYLLRPGLDHPWSVQTGYICACVRAFFPVLGFRQIPFSPFLVSKRSTLQIPSQVSRELLKNVWQSRCSLGNHMRWIKVDNKAPQHKHNISSHTVRLIDKIRVKDTFYFKYNIIESSFYVKIFYFWESLSVVWKPVFSTMLLAREKITVSK